MLIREDYIDDIDLAENYILESDATAIKAFLREMVTQSIVPFMESRVVTWNDQVASRRRGISGRFMSLSKRWTGFGSAKAMTAGSGGVPNSTGSNYNYQRGFYLPGTPEATMRQLGDYAFMLRDWKLAYSTYDFLRSDFSHDKAWNYHAAANEMAAISSLLIQHTFTSKSRSESMYQMLDTAAYSYLTRCSMPSRVIRCLTLAVELSEARSPHAVDEGARWGEKLLELSVLTPIAQALMTERVAECYMSQTSVSLAAAGIRKREAALWNILASRSWMRLDVPVQARLRLRQAGTLYGLDSQRLSGLAFPSMQTLRQYLHHALLRHEDVDGSPALIDISAQHNKVEPSITEESEQFNVLDASMPNYSVDTESFTTQDARHTVQASLVDTQLQKDGFE